MTAILSMRIAVRTFAAYRPAIGPGAFPLDLPVGTTPGQVWSTLAEQYPDLRRFPPPARFAVNDEVVGPEHALAGQEAIGSSAAALVAWVGDRRAGAVRLGLELEPLEGRLREAVRGGYPDCGGLAEREMR